MTTQGESDTKEKSLYERVGGEVPLRKLVDDFYDAMEESPYVQGIRQMHPSDMSSSRQKLFEFFSGWMGGPSLYIQKHGHPRLRARHLPFTIGEAERDQWLFCFHVALKKSAFDAELQEVLWQNICQIADHMRNQ